MSFKTIANTNALFSKKIQQLFIFDELEDFTVTTSFKNTSVKEAVKQVVGFYPMRISYEKKEIYVECVQKASLLAEKGDTCILLTYDAEEQKLRFDRSNSGTTRNVVHERECRLVSHGETLSLRIILDRYSCEVFINGGVKTAV